MRQVDLRSSVTTVTWQHSYICSFEISASNWSVDPLVDWGSAIKLPLKRLTLYEYVKFEAVERGKEDRDITRNKAKSC